MKRLLIGASLFAMSTALAAPPEGANPIYKPYYEGLIQQKTKLPCCSIADCRPVRTRFVDAKWEVFIDKQSFGDTADDEWHVVPPEAFVERNEAPTRPQQAVACWYNRQVRCFDFPLTEG